ncbi:MAG: hypothetical protein ABW046_11225 [Actinoplanes sp.]
MRIASAVFLGASLLTLTACGGEDTPAGTPAAAPATTSAAPVAESTATAASAAGDKDLCQAANKADKAMKAELIKAMQAADGDMDPAAYKKVLSGIADELNAAAASGDSPVAAAMKKFADQSSTAAAAADPETALADPAFEQSGKDLTAACKAAGVTVNY